MRREPPDHLAILVELAAGVETEIDGHPSGGVVIGMDVCGEVERSLVRQPSLHRRCRLPGEASTLPLGADHPCQLGVFAGHRCLHVADGDTVVPDDPVVPNLVFPRASFDLEAIALLKATERRWLTAGEDVEIGIGEDSHHLGCITDLQWGECETVSADELGEIDGATLAEDRDEEWSLSSLLKRGSG